MSNMENGKKSKTVEIIFWVVAALLIVAVIGLFISLTNSFKAEIDNREENMDNPSPDVNEQPDDGSNDITGDNGSNDNTGEDVSTPQLRWQLVEDGSELSAGDKIIIVATDYDFALGTVQNTSNRSQVSITKEGNQAITSDDVQMIILEQGLEAETYAFHVQSGYLYAPSSSSNNLKTKSTLDMNGCWIIEIGEFGIASIIAQGESERNVLMYNNVSSIFSCYALTNSQKTVSIYKLIASASE